MRARSRALAQRDFYRRERFVAATKQVSPSILHGRSLYDNWFTQIAIAIYASPSSRFLQAQQHQCPFRTLHQLIYFITAARRDLWSSTVLGQYNSATTSMQCQFHLYLATHWNITNLTLICHHLSFAFPMKLNRFIVGLLSILLVKSYIHSVRTACRSHSKRKGRVRRQGTAHP